MIPFSNFLNNIKLSFKKTVNGSPNASAKIKGDNATINQIVNSVAEPDAASIELSRQAQLTSALRNQWLLSNDGITPARMAGLEWGNGERAWVNDQLSRRGEKFTV